MNEVSFLPELIEQFYAEYLKGFDVVANRSVERKRLSCIAMLSNNSELASN